MVGGELPKMGVRNENLTRIKLLIPIKRMVELGSDTVERGDRDFKIVLQRRVIEASGVIKIQERYYF
jgi:hypothetical protein